MPVAEVYRSRPINCDPRLGQVGSEKRCPHCNQFHLRPGYCQALDPIYLKRIDNETFQSETDNETDQSSDETAPSATSICQGCNKPFEPKRKDAQFCSPACRLKSYRASMKNHAAS